MASINFPKEELDIIQRWREIKAFETQVMLQNIFIYVICIWTNTDSILPRSNFLKADRDTPSTMVPLSRLVSRMFLRMHFSAPELL